MALLTRSQVKQESVEANNKDWNVQATTVPSRTRQTNKGKGLKHIKKERGSVKRELLEPRPYTLREARSARLRLQKKAESTPELKPIKSESTVDEKPLKTENSTISIKKEEYLLSEEVIESRYSAAGVPKEPHPAPVFPQTFARTFFSQTYGGRFVDSVPKISATRLARHGLNDWLFCTPDFHPLAPQTPGERGLWFSSGAALPPGEPGVRDGDVRRVITRVRKAPSALWKYQGQYEIRLALPITGDEWLNQPIEVKKTWISKLHTSNWGSWFRARIYARREYGRNASEPEIKTIQEQGFDKSVTAEEVALALTRGDDQLNVYTMKCVGYEPHFQRELVAKYGPWKIQDDARKRRSAQKPRVRRTKREAV